MEWALFGSTFVISFVLIVILAEHLRQKRKIALREIIQKERITALERGIQLPEHNDVSLDEEHGSVSSSEQYRRKVQWFRFTTLSVGLFLIFGGVGFLLAFHFSHDTGFNNLATLGVLPFMAGLGLLLFYFLTGKEAA
jgi:hypothetical protein